MSDKETKGEMLVRMGRERRERAKDEPPKKPVNMLISKDRAILVEPTLARKDPALRQAQLDEKAAEEKRRLAKIEKAKKFNAEVLRKKLEAEQNRRDAEEKKAGIMHLCCADDCDNVVAEADMICLHHSDFSPDILEDSEPIDPEPVVNTATPAAQKLADEQDPPIDIQSLDGGVDNRINLGEVKAAIKQLKE